MSEITDLWFEEQSVWYCIDFFLDDEDCLAIRFELEEVEEP